MGRGEPPRPKVRGESARALVFERAGAVTATVDCWLGSFGCATAYTSAAATFKCTLGVLVIATRSACLSRWERTLEGRDDRDADEGGDLDDDDDGDNLIGNAYARQTWAVRI